MTRLYVYALLGSPPARAPGRGVVAEPVRIARVGRLFAAVGAMPEAPPARPATLRTHDAVVRRLARATGALLPVRFGTLVAGVRELSRALAPRAAELRAALALVEGREQMTLRVFATAGARQRRGRAGGGLGREPLRDVAPAARLGPGARYLATRMLAARRARRVPEIAWLRPALRPFVAAERVERYDAPPLVASVHHLIPRGDARAYLAAVASAATGRHDVRVLPSGPCPPYAFAPDTVGP
ncbi:MAG: GvpL/GvpF family gas vesicle protein [Candidatus Rokubacteria bacterium]|nr:GvpL/GvpF family gas vesicle protein [Candidatus Rokubacteria bacterium]